MGPLRLLLQLTHESTGILHIHITLLHLRYSQMVNITSSLRLFSSPTVRFFLCVSRSSVTVVKEFPHTLLYVKRVRHLTYNRGLNLTQPSQRLIRLDVPDTCLLLQYNIPNAQPTKQPNCTATIHSQTVPPQSTAKLNFSVGLLR